MDKRGKRFKGKYIFGGGFYVDVCENGGGVSVFAFLCFVSHMVFISLIQFAPQPHI